METEKKEFVTKINNIDNNEDAKTQEDNNQNKISTEDSEKNNINNQNEEISKIIPKTNNLDLDKIQDNRIKKKEIINNTSSIN